MDTDNMDESQRVPTARSARAVATEDAHLADAAMALLGCRREAEVYDVICDFMVKLLPGAVIVVDEITPDSNFYITRGIAGAPTSALSTAASLMGFEIIGKRWPILPAFRDQQLKGDLVRIPGGFADLAATEVPGPVAAALTKAFRIHDLYVIGIADRENALGNFAIITREPDVVLPTHIIEAFARHCYSAITNIRRMSELTKSAQSNALVLANMAEGLALHEIILDEDGHARNYRFLSVNPAFADLMGLAAEDLVGRTLLEIWPEAEPLWIQRYGEVVASGAPVRFQSYSEAVGKYFDVSAYSPQPGQFASVISDITDSKAHEARRAESECALQQSQTMLTTVLDAVPQAIFWKDPDGRYLGCNRVFAETAGFTAPHQIIGKTDYEMPWSSHQSDGYRADDREVLSLNRPKEHIIEMVTESGGRQIWADTTKVPLADDSGTPYGVLGVYTDITDSKLAGDTLKESERWLSESQRIAHLGHYVFDIGADRWDGSPSLYDVLGVGVGYRRDFDGWLDLVVPEDRERLSNYFTQDVLGQNKPFDIEYAIVRPRDGAERWVHGLGTVEFALDGQPLAMFGVIQDITERRRADELLAESLSSMISVVGRVVEMRDPYTAGHERRVAELAVSIAEEMGMPALETENIRIAALIHDVGKISVPAEILSRPGTLSPLEFELIKCHPESGYQILFEASMDESIAEMVRQHHERCDGSGYPRGLTSDEILVGAKVLMVADVVEAMVSHRPYRPGLGTKMALDEIEKGAGQLYDSGVAESCLRVFREQSFSFSPA